MTPYDRPGADGVWASAMNEAMAAQLGLTPDSRRWAVSNEDGPPMPPTTGGGGMASTPSRHPHNRKNFFLTLVQVHRQL